MRKRIALMIIASVLTLAFAPLCVQAREGDNGYEGGISSGETAVKKPFEYQEVCFLSGKPVVFKGTLNINKQVKADKITSVYTYNLKNLDYNATLTRTLSVETKLVTKENGQVVEESSLTRQPTETVKIGGTTYSLKSYDYTRSCLLDKQPAVNYFAGSIWGKKTYQVGTGTSGGTITVEATGEFYGYDQYWGTAEVEAIRYIIESEKKAGDTVDRWGGTARVTLSTSTTKQLKYVKNQPSEISFEGGYVQTQRNNSILEYSSKLPEFDKDGVSTDHILSNNGSLKLETFPVQTRLPSADMGSLRGHWAQSALQLLFGLEVFKGNARSFKPDLTMTRAEFAAAMVQAAREVPPDPALTKRTATRSSTTRRNSQQAVVSPFDDVSIDNVYFSQIDSAYKRGLIEGIGKNRFGPNNSLTVVDAAVIFVRTLGLESMAPSPAAVTAFRDNDLIPAHARDAMYVAEKVGLIKADSRGYIKPNEKLTRAKAAVLIERFIQYMQEGLNKDYRERIVNY